MPRILLFIFLIIQSLAYSQKTYNINKVDESEIIIDGFIPEKEIGRAHVRTPVTRGSRMPSSA